MYFKLFISSIGLIALVGCGDFGKKTTTSASSSTTVNLSSELGSDVLERASGYSCVQGKITGLNNGILTGWAVDVCEIGRELSLGASPGSLADSVSVTVFLNDNFVLNPSSENIGDQKMEPGKVSGITSRLIYVVVNGKTYLAPAGFSINIQNEVLSGEIIGLGGASEHTNINMDNFPVSFTGIPFDFTTNGALSSQSLNTLSDIPFHR